MKYFFIGWCNENNHDKVWGIIEISQNEQYGPDKYLTFWGRRGKKLQTKMFSDYVGAMFNLVSRKKKKGYIEIDEDKLDQVYPEFESDLSKTTMWAILKG